MGVVPDREDEVTLQLIAERMRGLRDLTDQGFKDMQRQLDAVSELPARVTALEVSQEALEERVGRVEESGTRGVEWRRGSLPMILLTLAIVVLSLVAILQQFLHH